MNVLVCIKQVPDNSVVPKLDPNTNRVVTEGVELMESPFDLNAVEAGLKLVEENGGEVSVLTLGGESAKTSLRYGLSMGAAKAYLLKDSAFEESDSWHLLRSGQGHPIHRQFRCHPLRQAGH